MFRRLSYRICPNGCRAQARPAGTVGRFGVWRSMRVGTGRVIDRRALLKDLQGQVRALEKDLVEQIGNSGDHYTKLHSEYDRAFELKRTAATWTAWRDERVTQTAVAWVLGSVFVRFCEDNGLIGDACYLAGPDKDRAVLAEESQEDFFREHPAKTDRDWLLAAFDHLGQTQAGRLLFDPEHNAAYQIPISHDAAKALIAFWRRRDPAGLLVHDFTDPEWDTRFLGDLYQDLSEARGRPTRCCRPRSSSRSSSSTGRSTRRSTSSAARPSR